MSASRRRAASASLAIVLLIAPSMAGCSSETQLRVLGLLFEDVPPTGEDAGAVPVVRRARHPPAPTPTPTPAEAGQAGAVGGTPAVFGTWDDVVRQLPKDQVGNPDWVHALQEKIIAPLPGVTPDASEQAILALDVELVPKSDPAFKVTFSHQKHGQWLACRNCHTDMFEMKAGATPMAAEAVHRDQYCAACHGKVAFDTVTGCPLCHLQNLPKDQSGRVDWSRALADKLIAPRAGPGSASTDQPVLDLDVELKPEAQPTLKGVFSHTTHTKWLACANCHPGLFPKTAAAGGPRGEDLHSRRYCGACHGSVSFGLTGNCGRCHPALQKARQHQEVLDLDVEVTPKSQPGVKTIFSHKAHRWVECATCHSNLYGTTAAQAQVAMADIYGGKYCAVCHGKVASDLTAQCQRCHPAGDAKESGGP